jgi:hypothetical integral membrane protein (TIGR02206 family)
MVLFGPVHLTILAIIFALAFVLAQACRASILPRLDVRLMLGYALAGNELIWWVFRYSHEGFDFHRNLPLQLCDITVWMTVAACLKVTPWVVEFDYFAGMAGAGMALLTPDLWSPWPSYPAIYFFIAHGGIVIGICVLVFGGIAPLRPGAMFHAFAGLFIYAELVGGFDYVFHTNYMYLCARPASFSVLDEFGPWPVYLFQAAGLTLVIFLLLWLPTRRDTYYRYIA